MDYRELDSNNYEVAIGEKATNGIQQITITVKRDAPLCEDCLSTEITKKCIDVRRVLDVVNKQPVQYTIRRYRYRCAECGHTFVNESLYAPKVRVALEFGKFLAQKILQDGLTEKEAAQKYGVSTTYVSEAIHAYEQEFEKDILSVAPCSVLAFYPFEYSSRVRCCVIGTNRNGKNVLLDILPDYSSITIPQFVHNKVNNPDELKAVYCDANPQVFAGLCAKLPNVAIRIFHDRLLRLCSQFNKDTGDGLFNEKNTHAKRFNAIIKSTSTSDMPLWLDLQYWWEATPNSVKYHFAPMWDCVESCLDGCENEPIPADLKSAIDATLAIIKQFRKNNVHFDIMILKTLFKDEAVIKRVKRTPYGNYMGMMCCISSGKSDYEVDIARLKQIYLQ